MINNQQSQFLHHCKEVHCANETALSNKLYGQYAPLPQANKIHLTEMNQKIECEHDWFFDILQQYRLNSKEGMLLMSLAEALIRIPDQQGAQALFYDRLHRGEWLKKENQHSLLAKALQWLGSHCPIDDSARSNLFNKITQHGAIEICSLFIEQMSQRFVFAETLDEALLRSRKLEQHEACSFDMLGEAALTYAEAEKYYQQYQCAILSIGSYNLNLKDTPHEVSVKLSALHPRYQPEKYTILEEELLPKISSLCLLAQKNNVKLTLDAEEQYRLELSIKLLSQLLKNNYASSKIHSIGIAVQAYSKRSLVVIEELKRLSVEYDCEITVRLVKGAYWDYEIKSAQQLGLKDYPVWSKKQLTDDCFLICAKALFNQSNEHNVTAQFASHNPETLLQLHKLQLTSPLLLQRLHGMGELQHAYMAENFSSQTRVYCPIGSYQKLLPYLVRRLIENGANSSFLYSHRYNSKLTNAEQGATNQQINKPENILDYCNSLSQDIRLDYHFQSLHKIVKQPISPLNIALKTNDEIAHTAQSALVGLHTMPNINDRVAALNLWAEQLEANKLELIAQLIQIAGKTYQDAIDEIREACDFCRYYAKMAKQLFSQGSKRPSITGELNQLSYKGKGIAVCISPWNFPLAIFVGQIAAAWVTGNSIIAKPAQQTLTIADKAIQLAYQAGIDNDQLQLVHCQGKTLVPTLLKYNAVQLVCFTGSTASAKQIQQTLASHDGPIIPFIAETGGQNVLIADSSALIDQLVPDIVQSAFYSAGQRCSALRVAYIQEHIFNDFCLALSGHMATLEVADPRERETDIGPIIDLAAVDKLRQHQAWLDIHGRKIAQSTLNQERVKQIPKSIQQRLFAPCAYQIESIKQIQEEHFGPILHVIPYTKEQLQQILTDINASGYGLTMGLHSRNQDWLEHIISQVNIGNIYINRNMIGAKVSSQPFGGHGLSGTGPKAGGPNYLNAMVDEYTVTTNITAWGGNPELL